MASYIPFVNGQDDCRILKQYYSESKIIRVSLEHLGSIRAVLPNTLELWVDAGIDGYEHHLKTGEGVPGYLRSFPEHKALSNKESVEKPNVEQISRFVDAVLDECAGLKPVWLTVPQLPVVDGNERNKINSALATLTREWKLKREFPGRLILPLIFTNKGQVEMKSKWRLRVDSACKWYLKAGADGMWVVDASLSDQTGRGTFRDRFPALIEMHNYLRSSLPDGARVIAGPYWGLNLVLWARGLCDNPAICLGSAYQYYISGGFQRRGNIKLAIPPLRRWAVASGALRDWLDKALITLNPQGEAYGELRALRKAYDSLVTPFASKVQIARFYKEWFDTIEQIPPAGRSLALYQDLSSAYVLGKHLPTLPPSGNSARKPEKVAEHYMLNCL
jgi:hypothetical protein